MEPEILEQSQKPTEAGCSSPGTGLALLRALLLRPLKALGNLFRFSGPGKAKPSRAARHRGPVQAELGLDMVKPVRNDLNDTDLELIPARKALADNDFSATLVKEAVSTPKAARAVPSKARSRTPKASAQQNVFSPPEEGAAEPAGAPELVGAGKSDLVGAWWGRLRTGLLKIKSREP